VKPNVSQPEPVLPAASDDAEKPSRLPGVAGLVDVPKAVAFGLFFAWQESSINMLSPLSNGLGFSPLVCQAFACCLVLVIAILCVVRNRAALPPRVMAVSACVIVGLTTVAGGFAATGTVGGVFPYVTAVLVGASSATMFYGWAALFAELDESRRMGTLIAALLLSGTIGAVVGLLPAGWLIRAAVVLLAVGLLLGFCRALGRARGSHESSLLVRPSHASHFRWLIVAIVLYAFVFGESAGGTAYMANVSFMTSFARGTNLSVAVVAVLLFAGLALHGRPPRLSTVGRLLTPVLAILFLSHILLNGNGNDWLPRLTAGFWQFVQIFVFLVLIDVAHSGLASLSLVFPIGWAAVSLGYACGAFAGQMAGCLFGNDVEWVTNITVSLVIVAVVASSILGAAQFPQVDPEAPVLVPGDEATGAAPAAAAVDLVGAACADLVGRYALSGREAEVLELLAHGNTRASIAEKLCISENTVRVHVKNIYAKLHIHSKQQLIDLVDKRVAQQRDSGALSAD
jgi:DNA-binding CsgD family transcriptional regulator